VSNNKQYDVIIIGGGAAGLSASIYAVRYNLKTLVLSKDFGGQILETSEIENYPGFSSIKGPELSENMKKHAEGLGAKLKMEEVKNISTEELFQVTTDSSEYTSKSLIYALGAEHKKLGIPGESELAGKGVSYCATCDGPFFKDKVVAVVGGGDAGVTGAIDVANYAKKVYLIHRSKDFKAKPANVDEAKKLPNLEFIPETNVTKALKRSEIGKKSPPPPLSEFLGAVELDKPYQDKTTLEVDGLFIEIGFKPASKLALKLGIDLDEKGYIKVGEDQSTNIEGVFAAGDTTTGSNRFAQLTTAVSEGSIAAQAAYHYLQKRSV